MAVVSFSQLRAVWFSGSFLVLPMPLVHRPAPVPIICGGVASAPGPPLQMTNGVASAPGPPSDIIRPINGVASAPGPPNLVSDLTLREMAVAGSVKLCFN